MTARPRPAELPGLDEVARCTFADEAALDRTLIERARLDAEQSRRTDALARRLVHAARAGRHRGGLDSFLHEYGLGSEEGVVLMCLAEALLRIPDPDTADRLIADKLAGRAWDKHLGHSDSLLVNASTWGLMLTGRVMALGRESGDDVAAVLKRLVLRSGEPLIRQAVRQAMRIMGRQFVLGRTIEEALARARPFQERGYSFSYDMLGEAAVTARDAERYFAAYLGALRAVADARDRDEAGNRDPFAAPSLSVKLSALHPRYEPRQRERAMAELLPRLLELARRARARGLGLTVDAEEAERLTLGLELFGTAFLHPDLAGWNGFGLAVQAYGKRAHAALEWLREVAARAGKRIPVRLVKGAYWDTEIKRAQESGLADYPVFTRKPATDVSFIACAKYLLAHDEFHPQFATHNAHTVAAVHTLAGARPYEFQRLHGMGQALYDAVVGADGLGLPCRIYAPVGSHEDLLAYLVRRLLENGANTSFVNRLADDEAPISEIVADPVNRLAAAEPKPNPRIPLPRDIFRPLRTNSAGLALWERPVREALVADMRAALTGPAAGPIVGKRTVAGPAASVRSPHDRDVEVGRVADAGPADIARALDLAAAAQAEWDAQGGAARADILEHAADLYEANRAPLMALLVREAGRTLDNALAELREAVDFLRYYATRARAEFEAPTALPGPTGEENTLQLKGRGVFACISPWNFPLAIFTGQVAAALAAGNAVAAKPAEQTPLIAFEAVRLLLRAGVPANVLSLLPGPGDVGAALVRDRRVSGVAFTGSNETAAAIRGELAARGGPIARFVAETGGINAMIVDSTALPEQAVRDVVRSAFDSAGQRCSAARALFVQSEVADKVMEMLAGAMAELGIGDPFDYATDVGPVIDEAARDALEAHKRRMRREGRTLAETPLGDVPPRGLYVAPAAFEIEHMSRLEREVFGPVLHVIRFAGDRLDAVCDAINETGYGLTLGIHTRIQATADFVAARVRVGNIYVNRNQIGAVVGAQPFGGEGLSGTGPKAGGPFYLHAFAVERVRSTDITASGGNARLLSLDPG